MDPVLVEDNEGAGEFHAVAEEQVFCLPLILLCRKGVDVLLPELHAISGSVLGEGAFSMFIEGLTSTRSSELTAVGDAIGGSTMTMSAATTIELSRVVGKSFGGPGRGAALGVDDFSDALALLLERVPRALLEFGKERAVELRAAIVALDAFAFVGVPALFADQGVGFLCHLFLGGFFRFNALFEPAPAAGFWFLRRVWRRLWFQLLAWPEEDSFFAASA